MNFEVVVAVDQARGIGKNNQVPWNLPTDLKHFVKVTKAAPPGEQNAIVMGRNTWESIPERFRPLAGRKNIVMSRQRVPLPDGVLGATDFESAVELGRGCHKVFVIGGGSVYEQALKSPNCRVIHLTVIEADFGCDVFFPALPPRFVLAESSPRIVENGISFTFQRYLGQL